MDRTERLYKIEKLLRQQQTVSFAALQAALEVSRATLKRDLDYLRTRLNAPIEWNRAAGGYLPCATHLRPFGRTDCGVGALDHPHGGDD